MIEERQEIEREIALTTASLTERAAELEQRVEVAKVVATEVAKRSPWLLLGASFAVGLWVGSAKVKTIAKDSSATGAV